MDVHPLYLKVKNDGPGPFVCVFNFGSKHQSTFEERTMFKPRRLIKRFGLMLLCLIFDLFDALFDMAPAPLVLQPKRISSELGISRTDENEGEEHEVCRPR